MSGTMCYLCLRPLTSITSTQFQIFRLLHCKEKNNPKTQVLKANRGAPAASHSFVERCPNDFLSSILMLRSYQRHIRATRRMPNKRADVQSGRLNLQSGLCKVH